MSARRTPGLLVSTVVAFALLVSGGLVAATTAPAAATPIDATYVCTFPLFDDLEVPVTIDVPDLPTELPVGIPVPDGTWDVEGLLVLPDLVLTLLLGVLGISGTLDDFELLLGDEPVPVDLTSPLDSLPLGDIDLPLGGSNRGFVPSETGQQLLTLPETFELRVLDSLGLSALDVTCEWDDGDDLLGTVKVVKQTSSMTSKVVKKPVKVGKRAKVLVSVVNQLHQGATGQVVAKLKGRTIGTGKLSKGTTRIKLGALPVGKHRIQVSYLGSDTVARATRNVTVRVVRRRS